MGNGRENAVEEGDSHGHWLKLPAHVIIPAYLLLVGCVLCLASVRMLIGAHEVSGLRFHGLTLTHLGHGDSGPAQLCLLRVHSHHSGIEHEPPSWWPFRGTVGTEEAVSAPCCL